jgi:cytochrome b561
MAQQKRLDRVPLEYSKPARQYHWLSAGIIFTMLALGEIMTNRSEDKTVVVNGKSTVVPGIWDATTNALYSSHKLIGFLFLFVIAARLIYRVRNGAPPDEPTLEPWQKAGAHLTHWGLYALMIGVPLGGWIGVQLYPSREIFGLFSLPAFLSPNQAMAETVFMFHSIGAKLIMLLLLAHIGAAIFHHVIKKDGVLRRMWPAKQDR